MRGSWLTCIGIGMLLAGCSSDDGNDRRYPEICDKIVECGAMSEDNCISVYEPLVFSEDCLSAVNSASCEEHLASPPSYLDVCFPPCMGTEATCLGDEITVCSQGRTKTSLCVEVCKMSGKDYVGVCADQYGEEMSLTGMDICWCE